ncbi:YTH domain-containing protein ECT2-like [Aristolochia californica]|uniref:YTH domain-containing protein ECT2-like n=1 Tax=Aristolochia californica TaxID=171875 RepID=UPI0035D76399
MATVAPASDQTADLLQKLSLDSQPKTLEVPEVAKKPSPSSWLDGPVFTDGKHRPATTSTSRSSPASHISSIPPARNHNLHPVPHLIGLHPPRPTSGMGSTPGFLNRIYPNNRIYGNCGNAVRTGPCYGSNGYDARSNGRGWLSVDNKYKSRSRGNGFFGYGNENSDGFNELNRGSRARPFQNQKGFGPQVAVAVKGQYLPSNGNTEDSIVVQDRNQYNREDFAVKYIDAKFFVIKSYSEDDIHKASTPCGNKKLDVAYQEAQEKSGGCPVFLFFSVNTSGQFVGLGEMVERVDFNKNLEYRQLI